MKNKEIKRKESFVDISRWSFIVSTVITTLILSVPSVFAPANFIIFLFLPSLSLFLYLSLSLSLSLLFPISMMFSALLIFFILTVGNHSNTITVYSLLIYNSFCFYPNVCSHCILMNVWYARVSKKQLWWSYEDFSKRSTKFNNYLLWGVFIGIKIVFLCSSQINNYYDIEVI